MTLSLVVRIGVDSGYLRRVRSDLQPNRRDWLTVAYGQSPFPAEKVGAVPKPPTLLRPVPHSKGQAKETKP